MRGGKIKNGKTGKIKNGKTGKISGKTKRNGGSGTKMTEKQKNGSAGRPGTHLRGATEIAARAAGHPIPGSSPMDTLAVQLEALEVVQLETLEEVQLGALEVVQLGALEVVQLEAQLEVVQLEAQLEEVQLLSSIWRQRRRSRQRSRHGQRSQCHLRQRQPHLHTPAQEVVQLKAQALEAGQLEVLAVQLEALAPPRNPRQLRLHISCLNAAYASRRAGPRFLRSCLHASTGPSTRVVCCSH